MFYVQRFLVVPFMLYHELIRFIFNVSPDESLCEQGHLCFFLVVHKLDPDGTEGGRRQKDKHPIFAIPSHPNCHVRRRGTFQAWRCFFGGAPSNAQLKELSGCGVQDQVLRWESECQIQYSAHQASQGSREQKVLYTWSVELQQRHPLAHPVLSQPAVWVVKIPILLRNSYCIILPIVDILQYEGICKYLSIKMGFRSSYLLI